MKNKVILQEDSSDCGVACLASIIHYYDGNYTYEDLRIVSGTSTDGTSLQGIIDAARYCNFQADAFYADISDLKKIDRPVILHVNINELYHYVVLFKFDNNKFIIGDPADGIKLMTVDEINSIWVNKALVDIQKNKQFQYNKSSKYELFKTIYLILDINLFKIGSLFILGLIISLLGLSTSIYMQKLVDKIMPSNDKSLLISSIVIFSAILTIRVVLVNLRDRLLFINDFDISKNLSDGFYKNIYNIPMSFFKSRATADIINRFNDIAKIRQFITNILSQYTIDILTIIISCVIVGFYNINILVISSIGLFIYLFLSIKLNNTIEKYQKKVLSQKNKHDSRFIEFINNIDVIKSHGKSKMFQEASINFNDIYNRQVLESNLESVKISTYFEVIAIVLIISIISMSAHLAFVKSISFGKMISIVSILGILSSSVSKISLSIIQFHNIKISFKRIWYVINFNQNDNIEKTSSIKLEQIYNVDIKNIKFAYSNSNFTLNNLNINAKAGETIALVGKSGSGKSTVLGLLSGLLDYTSGSILINGISIKDINTYQLQESISYAAQQSHIFSGTLMDNILFNVNSSENIKYNEEKERVVAFCNNYGFSFFFNHLPDGLDTYIGEGGIALSGGQKQLVCLARSIYRNPKILLLDEVTSGLDSDTEKYVMSLINHIKLNKITFIATHKKEIVDMCDKVYYL